ncbi:KGG domain-containing protein [Sporosarcina cascadiensis]|uniref:KGG domain-containing protein n=1 Tax=Sporosarcina cascadiensis TaxID=2660747 RepID=UPI00129B0058|nr:KGG domain-containing protein [Sporosarcina cascadiensis]
MAKRNNNQQDQNKMSLEEAGKKGGEATARNHGHEFYEEIGRKGGEARARQNDSTNNSNNQNKNS